MNDAISAVIGDSLPYVAGLLLSLYVVAAVYIVLLEGLRVDRWGVFKKGVVKKLYEE